MRRIWLLALLTASVTVTDCIAVEVGNVRVTTGFLGSKRLATKFLPGDLIFLNFDIRGLKRDAKSGLVIFHTKMEITDQLGKEVFKQTSPPKSMLLLGGDCVPSVAAADLGAKQPAGKYTIKITVTDILAKQKKTLEHNFEVLPIGFGIVRPTVAAVGFVGQDLPVTAALVGMKRDKYKLPDAFVTLRVTDASGEVVGMPVKINVRTLHDPIFRDLTRKSVMPIALSLFLNRPGQFTIQLEASDEIGKQKTMIRLPLRVLNASNFGAG